MSSEKYNGWTNFATWQVAVELGNTESLYLDCIEIAIDVNCQGEHDQVELKIQRHVENELLNRLDMEHHAWRSINWAEIAEDFQSQAEDYILDRKEKAAMPRY